MNADFEHELAAPPGAYRRRPAVERENRRLAPLLLWLAGPGDALLLDEPWTGRERGKAARRGVELLAPGRASAQGGRLFTPWGWTPSAVAAGRRAGARVEAVAHETVVRVNSKLFSHSIERELGVAVPGATLAASLEELHAAAARACPRPDDKWVVKAPLGFAARERVLGRGPAIDAPSAVWAAKRLARGETLLFEPWLDVRREYGVPVLVSPGGETHVLGVVDLVTNGAGAAVGYMLGRAVPREHAAALDRIAREAGRRLAAAGYIGPAGVDALEHAGGLRPLLEINARYTMGFVVLALERALAPTAPVFWSPKEVADERR